jgi:DNA-binding CsgD family transcriptional regulator
VPYLPRLVRVSVALHNTTSASMARDSRGIAETLTTCERQSKPSSQTPASRSPKGGQMREACWKQAITRLEGQRLTLEAARARLLLVDLVMESEPELAALEARTALRSPESSGAEREADKAAALLRALDGSGRARPKRYSGLTKRELEVLDLLGEGLTKGEIAEGLFISVKTAGHHVSNVLMKPHLKSRTEAAVTHCAAPTRSTSDRPCASTLRTTRVESVQRS